MKVIASPVGWAIEVGGLVLEVAANDRQGPRRAVAVRRDGALLYRDRVDLASVKSREQFLRKLRQERGIEIAAEALMALGDAVIQSASAANSREAVDSNGNAEAPQYENTPEGLVWLKTTRDGIVRTPLTNFRARIIEEVVEDDGVETRNRFVIEADLKGQTTTVSVPASAFPVMNWSAEQLGAKGVVYAGLGLKDHARVAIQMLSGDPPRRRVYTHMGWRELDSGYAYLHGGGAIGTVGTVSGWDNPAGDRNNDTSMGAEAVGTVPGIEVALPEPLARYVLPAPPRGPELVEAVRATLRLLDVALTRITVPLLAAIARAVLGETDFSIYLSGPTGVHKTGLTALVQQHWGAGMDERNLPGAWSSTANSLEALAFHAKDAILAVDDFAPGGSQHDVQRLHREADRLLRAQGNRAGRGRMRSDGNLRQSKPPRGMIPSTGEDVPRGQSLRARTLIIEMAPGDVDRQRLTQCQRDAAAGRYAEALAGFIAAVAPRYRDVLSQLRDDAKKLRDELTFAGHARTADIVANLAVGFRDFLRFAATIGAISRADAQALWREGWQALMVVSRAQRAQQVSEDPAQRFIELLRAAFTSGRAHVKSLPSSDGPRGHLGDAWGWHRDGGTEPRPRGSCIGWVEGSNLYLEPDAAYAAVQGFAHESGESIGVSKGMLHKRVNERGLLASTDRERDRLTVRKTIEKVRIDVLHLRAETIYPAEPSQPSQSAQTPAEPDLPPLFPGEPTPGGADEEAA